MSPWQWDNGREWGPWSCTQGGAEMRKLLWHFITPKWRCQVEVGQCWRCHGFWGHEAPWTGSPRSAEQSCAVHRRDIDPGA